MVSSAFDLPSLSASLCPRGRKLAGVLLALVSLTWRTGFAVPHIPSNDAMVLEHVPAAVASRKLEPLRARWAAHPEDLRNALILAQGYLDIGRATADPRFVSYAQATLKPWLSREHPDPAVLTLAAACLQYLHRFDDALVLLDRALAAQRFNGQAWLTKATILLVQGRFAPARQACRPLIQISGHLIALTCLTSVNALTGELTASYHALNGVFTDDPRLEVGVRVWILDELADMAQRMGNDRAAEAHLLAALQVAPQDGYSKAAYADLLLGESRNTEVVQLLREDESQDNLLLRLAIAATRLRTAQAQRYSELFQARYEAARRDGDFTHLREQARFILEVRGDAAQALQLAERNWQVQREPADVRIYYAAATAAADKAALRTLEMWLKQTHYEDRTLDSLTKVGDGPTHARMVVR
jgi:tetratricopeptide (TPR) repeat protein